MVDNTAGLSPDAGISVPRLKLGEVGFVGLKMTHGWIMEQGRRDLRWPWSMATYKMMAMDADIASAISVYEMMIARIKWNVKPPPDADEADKARTKFIQECMDDMEHTWFDFIKEVTSMFTFGFCVNEKVYRRRYRANGSRYNDGYIGIRKLPTRSQDTIWRWNFSPDGQELEGLRQNLNIINSYAPATNIPPVVDIPREKFMLFRTNVRRNNPEGISPLNSCYLAWKFKTTLEEHEAIGISR